MTEAGYWYLTLTLLGALSAMTASPAPAQSYRLRIDARAQAVSFRGIALDSVLATDTVSGAGGAPQNEEGITVRCRQGDPYCRFFRPGPTRRGGPLTTVANLSMWGFGIRGLSIRATSRVGTDLGDVDAWPGADPAVQLIEGYAEYATARVTARLGRQYASSRLGTNGFDGARATVRLGSSGLFAGAYLGRGLARGVALPLTSPALNPLDDFQPRDEQIVAGAESGWRFAHGDLRVAYHREVDAATDQFASERTGVDLSLVPLRWFRLALGGEYDIAANALGTAEAVLTLQRQRWNARAGARRYRPHFDLWTIWGAFSPVPYHAVFAGASFRLATQVRIDARAERYWFNDADAVTPGVNAESDGWRWNGSIAVQPTAAWQLTAGVHAEFGPGAASRGLSSLVTYMPGSNLSVTGHAAVLERPLEFRFSDARVRRFGLDADLRAHEQLRLGLGASRYVEDRDRPDAGAIEWGQFRLTARATVFLGGGADTRTLPPGRPRGRASGT